MNFLKNITKTSLFKISSLNSVSVLVKILGGLISSKIIAVFLAPGGLAFVGNFRNFITLIDTFSTLGFQNGIIKYVAENEKDSQKLNGILTTVFVTLLFAVLLMSGILFAAANSLSVYFFNSDGRYGWIFIVSALCLPWYAGNMLLVSVLNGLGKYKQVIRINIWGNITGVLLSAVLIWQFKISGALLGLILPPSLLFIFSFYLLRKQFPELSFLKKENFDFGYLKGFFSYSLMTVVAVVLGTCISIYIRNTLINNYSQQEAGYWEAINRLSGFYLMFVSTLLTVYFLPKLSQAESNEETKQIFWSYYKGIVPVFGLGLIAIYLLRDFIVRLLLTKEFLPMEDLFSWQLAGDFLKICSLILGYEFFAKKMLKAFIVFEVISCTILFISSYYLISLYGSEGAVMAHVFTYLIYLIVMIVFFRKKLF